jgi:hypothetical protein
MGSIGIGVIPKGGGNNGKACEDCPWLSTLYEGGYCSADRQYFINGGNGKYKPNGDLGAGTCTWTECEYDASSPTGQTCTEYQEVLSWAGCMSKNSSAVYDNFGDTEFTTEEIYTELINCFDYRHNSDRYNRNGAGTILNHALPEVSVDIFGSIEPGNSVSANKGCGLGVVSNGHGRLSNCDDAQSMGTLLNHWQFGDESDATPNAPKTPIKSCILPRNWTPQDTINFIQDHWQTTGNPEDRGPSQHPRKRPGSSGFTFRKSDTNLKINYKHNNDKNDIVNGEYGLIYKLIKTTQNGKIINICAPIFDLNEEYKYLPNCD